MWFGPVEQAICSRAVHFSGTQISTFSGYILRLRGMMSDILGSFFKKNKKIKINFEF